MMVNRSASPKLYHPTKYLMLYTAVSRQQPQPLLNGIITFPEEEGNSSEITLQSDGRIVLAPHNVYELEALEWEYPLSGSPDNFNRNYRFFNDSVNAYFGSTGHTNVDGSPGSVPNYGGSMPALAFIAPREETTISLRHTFIDSDDFAYRQEIGSQLIVKSYSGMRFE